MWVPKIRKCLDVARLLADSHGVGRIGRPGSEEPK